MKRLIWLLIIAFLFLPGCATSIAKISKDYSESSDALRGFAAISAKDWMFGSGMIRGAIDPDMLPIWVNEAFDEIDKWFEDNQGELTDYQQGYLLGLRARLSTPIIQAAIEQYAPGLLNIKEVISVLAFIGL